MYACVTLLMACVVISCGDDGTGGAPEIPPALIKTLSINEDGDVTTWTFTYDNQDRLTRTDVVDPEGFEYFITYDYDTPGRLIETEVYGEDDTWVTTFVLDSEGRIIKELWEPEEGDDDYFTGYEYDEDGYLVRIYEKDGGAEVTKETATVVNDNITVHTQYNGIAVVRTKEFTYLPSATALNVSNLPQSNLRNSERRTVSGLYGKGSKKLLDYLELDYTGEPEAYAKNSNAYTFDDDNRVLTITRTGVNSEGNDTGLNEVFTYTYYEEEE